MFLRVAVGANNGAAELTIRLTLFPNTIVEL